MGESRKKTVMSKGSSSNHHGGGGGGNNSNTENTSLILSRIGAGTDGLPLIRTRQSYRTMKKAPGNVDAEHEFLDHMHRLAHAIMEQLRTNVPKHASLHCILDVVYDEGPGRYFLVVSYYKLESALQGKHKPMDEPRQIDFAAFSVKLCDCVPVVELVANVIKKLTHQKRSWFLSMRRYSFSAPATTRVDAAVDGPLGYLGIDPPVGYMRHYMLWVNDLHLAVMHPDLWRERRRFFLGPVPEHLRAIAESPRSDTNTDSMSTIEEEEDDDADDDDDEEEDDHHGLMVAAAPAAAAADEDGDQLIEETTAAAAAESDNTKVMVV